MVFILSHIFQRKVNMSVERIVKIFVEYRNHKPKSSIRIVVLKYETRSLAPRIQISET